MMSLSSSQMTSSPYASNENPFNLMSGTQFGNQIAFNANASRSHRSNAGSNFDFLPSRKDDETIKITLTRTDENWMQLRQLAEESAALGDLSTAEKMWLAALRETAAFEESDVRRVITLDKLSSLYLQLGRYDQAELYCKASLIITEKRSGTRQHRSVADCLNRLAQVYYHKGDYISAEPLCLEVLSIYKQLRCPNNVDIGMALNNLATLYHSWEQPAQSEKYYLDAIRHQIETLGARDPKLATLLNSYKSLRAKMNKNNRKNRTTTGIRTLQI